MKIGLFTDLHYCDKESISNRRPRLSYNKAQEAMEHFKKNNVDLVVCLGDLVDDCDNKEKNIIEIKKICQMIHSYNIPFFSLMGNHDYQNFTREEFALYSGGAYPPFMYECHNNTLVFLDSNYSSNGEIYVSNNIDWTDAKLPNDQMDALKRILNTKKNI